jgi:hypothetical protein
VPSKWSAGLPSAKRLIPLISAKPTPTPRGTDHPDLTPSREVLRDLPLHRGGAMGSEPSAPRTTGQQ